MQTPILSVIILTCLSASALAFDRSACKCDPCEEILAEKNKTWNELLNTVLKAKNISTALDTNCNLRFYIPKDHRLTPEEKEFVDAKTYLSNIVTSAVKNNLFAVAIKPESFNAHLNNIKALEQMTKKVVSSALKIKQLKKIIIENDCLPYDDHEVATKRKSKNKKQRKITGEQIPINGTSHQTKKHKILKKKKNEALITVQADEQMQGDSPYADVEKNLDENLDMDLNDEQNFDVDEIIFGEDDDNEIDLDDDFRPPVPIEKRTEKFNPQLFDSIMAVSKYSNHLKPEDVNKKLDLIVN